MRQKKAWTIFVTDDIAHQSSFELPIVNVRKNWSGRKNIVCPSDNICIQTLGKYWEGRHVHQLADTDLGLKWG